MHIMKTKSLLIILSFLTTLMASSCKTCECPAYSDSGIKENDKYYSKEITFCSIAPTQIIQKTKFALVWENLQTQKNNLFNNKLIS